MYRLDEYRKFEIWSIIYKLRDLIDSYNLNAVRTDKHFSDDLLVNKTLKNAEELVSILRKEVVKIKSARPEYEEFK